MRHSDGSLWTFDTPEAALNYLETAPVPIVLKADGLALGKAFSFVLQGRGKEGVRLMLDSSLDMPQHDHVVVRAIMTGREVSVLSAQRNGRPLADHDFARTTSVQDEDQGLNTEGMGYISWPFYTPEVDEFCKKHIYQATVDAMKAEGREFKGIIFFGFCYSTADGRGSGIQCVSAIRRQVVLPKMKNDIVDVFGM